MSPILSVFLVLVVTAWPLDALWRFIALRLWIAVLSGWTLIPYAKFFPRRRA